MKSPRVRLMRPPNRVRRAARRSPRATSRSLVTPAPALPVSAERRIAAIRRWTFSASAAADGRLPVAVERVEEIRQHAAMMLVRERHRIGAGAAAVALLAGLEARAVVKIGGEHGVWRDAPCPCCRSPPPRRQSPGRPSWWPISCRRRHWRSARPPRRCPRSPCGAPALRCGKAPRPRDGSPAMRDHQVERVDAPGSPARRRRRAPRCRGRAGRNSSAAATVPDAGRGADQMRPSSPPGHQLRAARRPAGRKRCCRTTPSLRAGGLGTPRPAPAPRSMVISSGFSRSTCLPAAAARRDEVEMRVGRRQDHAPPRSLRVGEASRRGRRSAENRKRSAKARAPRLGRAVGVCHLDAVRQGRAGFAHAASTAMPSPMMAMRFRAERVTSALASRG